MFFNELIHHSLSTMGLILFTRATYQDRMSHNNNKQRTKKTTKINPPTNNNTNNHDGKEKQKEEGGEGERGNGHENKQEETILNKTCIYSCMSMQSYMWFFVMLASPLLLFLFYVPIAICLLIYLNLLVDSVWGVVRFFLFNCIPCAARQITNDRNPPPTGQQTYTINMQMNTNNKTQSTCRWTPRRKWRRKRTRHGRRERDEKWATGKYEGETTCCCCLYHVCSHVRFHIFDCVISYLYHIIRVGLQSWWWVCIYLWLYSYCCLYVCYLSMFFCIILIFFF